MYRAKPGEAYVQLIRQARRALENGDNDAADRLARRALALDPSFGDAYLVVALVYERRGEFAKAQDLLRACLCVEPWHRAAERNLARLTDFSLRSEPQFLGDDTSDRKAASSERS